MFRNHKQRHMFSFITGKVLGVFIKKKFALYLEHFHEYNGVIFVLKNLNLEFVFVIPILLLQQQWFQNKPSMKLIIWNNTGQKQGYK